MQTRSPSPGVRAVFRWSAIVLTAPLLFMLVGVAGAEQATEFDLKEVSTFAEPGSGTSPMRISSVRGQATGCSDRPNPAVKKYPDLQSENPYYGTITFGRNTSSSDSGKTFYFVIDESGESADEDKPKEEPEPEEADSASLLDTLSAALGISSRPAIRRPAAEENVITYDRLYFDADGDLDLTNDPVLKPITPPPGAELRYSSRQKVVYDYLSIPLDRGPDLGVGPVRVLPRFFIYESGETSFAQIDFVAATVRQGKVQIGETEYVARLSQRYSVGGRFDTPYVNVSLTPVGSPQPGYPSNDQMLSSLRVVDGKYYALSTTPGGDKLFVKPYDGDMGTLEIAAGPRVIEGGFSFSGELRSEDMQLPVGEQSFGLPGEATAVARYEIPVGDYYPGYSTIQFGGLSVSVSNNYHADGAPRNRTTQPAVYGIKIAKGETFVLDFSTEPEVLFAQPAKDSSVAPGEEIEVKAVLVDPEQDIMIRRLYAVNESVKTTINLPDGTSRPYSQRVSLDPDVVITDASGKEVGGGKLPFG